MTPRSDVAVIIAVYNGERFLAEAIRSALAQTVAPFEIIVVDDGSTDGSAEIARRFDVRYYYQPNAGVGAARNAGLEMATGSFVAFLDADDRWCVEKLERQLAALSPAPPPATRSVNTWPSSTRMSASRPGTVVRREVSPNPASCQVHGWSGVRHWTPSDGSTLPCGTATTPIGSHGPGTLGSNT